MQAHGFHKRVPILDLALALHPGYATTVICSGEINLESNGCELSSIAIVKSSIARSNLHSPRCISLFTVLSGNILEHEEQPLTIDFTEVVRSIARQGAILQDPSSVRQKMEGFLL